jgi:MOSC domain-containing protein YiiM
MELRVLSVNIARPRIIGHMNGEPVLSGIAKRPADRARIFVGATNISGDEQADLSVHGGPDKAVYAYPADHWPWWEAKGITCAPATFGENLTLEGADETAIAIGDRFRWGEAILEVCQPRGPCFKLGLHTNRADAPQAMTISGRCGWYLRVIEEGEAPVHNAVMTRISTSDSPNVRQSFFAVYDPRTAPAIRARVHRAEALAENWRNAVAQRIRT